MKSTRLDSAVETVLPALESGVIDGPADGRAAGEHLQVLAHGAALADDDVATGAGVGGRQAGNPREQYQERHQEGDTPRAEGWNHV